MESKGDPMSDRLTVNDFEPLIDTTFYITLGSGDKVTLNLREVNRWGEAVENYQPFSLLFIDAEHSDAYLPQQTFLVEHEQLGNSEIFLVPLGPDNRGMRYEAVFS
jgi:hypothetical protein